MDLIGRKTSDPELTFFQNPDSWAKVWLFPVLSYRMGGSQAGSMRLECEEQLEHSRTMDKVEEQQDCLC